MTDRRESVWLGPLRQPMRKLMIASTIATGALSFFLITGTLFFGTGIGLKQFLSPGEIPSVALTMIVGFVALLSASIYFSDTRGMIEPEAKGFFDVVSLICSRLSMIATAVIVLVMFYEVVSRYVFTKPTLWANELSLWIAGFVFLLAGLYAMQQRSHIRIYVVYDLFPRWLQKLSDVVSVILIWAFTFMLIWGGYNESRDKILRWETFGTAWDPPIPATIKPAILFIILLVAVQALSNLIADWKKMPEHHSPIDEIDESEIEIIRRSIKD
ncbi:TRAP-type mannitol/chloroaromatic compound transport system permease small subunit [Hoeflea halophila]|uniref:TRAP transporter small permease protein n=1 Tax=Hoeflea halophila TaxID=714899 RepID=A0A286IF45_9HYPH|nr:TRAP transporter small permease [Hoeflea halophila]SOE18276.1 TRAP-type mannitol/chloroaromatic compound transport system permease small subunit [Hoeflea halophila]